MTQEMLLRTLKDDYGIHLVQLSPRIKRTIPELLTLSNKSWIKPKAVYGIFSCQTKGNQLILNSKKGVLTTTTLAKNFEGNTRIGLFVVTIGKELEEKAKLFPKYLYIIIEAIGSGMVDECAEYIHRRVVEPLLIKENQVTTRLSPGWGEHKGVHILGITNQKVIFDLLHPEKIGVKLTSGYEMIPRKSVSAIVAIKNTVNLAQKI